MTLPKTIPLFELNQKRNNDQLLSNDNFDRVTTEKNKPETGISGLKTLDSAVESDKSITINANLSQLPNLYKQTGSSMSDDGYIKIPRSLLNNPIWQGCREKYKKVFLTILLNVSYREQTFSIGDKIIEIKPGQFCTSLLNLVELCNKGVRFKEDKIDKNIVERSVSLFTRCQLLRQEVRHGKSVITITHPEIYNFYNFNSETRSETKPRQNRDIKEEYIDKEDKSSLIADDVKTPSDEKKSSISKKRKKVTPQPLIERDTGVFTSEIAHAKLVAEKGSEEIVKNIYCSIAIWKAQKGIS